ncbi:hypothetical protein SmaMPs15_000072 [Stenotrophomonas maltophilia phage vB_SmaM_Ps15]|uniref:Uncharacterized protein n=1 Tax=Stenotrophomonas maltophilia phage vB_SmaM_Ps15 TaxID=3071007 RepID=A0AAE9JU83_9CAUD|nr:hypothetical protein PQC01_gp072 [Stenotrophomonas maltophilia phage vB_SmaM_Ps15]UMO77223.1 hypothetical protein SmaMPs15_000072 [Stenotrophomonas maltophilia phage vB_SmaM_Ps15]
MEIAAPAWPGYPDRSKIPADWKPIPIDEPNQCDGCNVGMKLNDRGQHVSRDSMMPHMSCQKRKYQQV